MVEKYTKIHTKKWYTLMSLFLIIINMVIQFSWDMGTRLTPNEKRSKRRKYSLNRTNDCGAGGQCEHGGQIYKKQEVICTVSSDDE